mmetsp:Transcript_15245/g.27016  ORF Transcript_15245/g.27016 Transcript_15245/m.27016 type:complete len:83 (+) Transcript_15245:1923-2171(+)
MHPCTAGWTFSILPTFQDSNHPLMGKHRFACTASCGMLSLQSVKAWKDMDSPCCPSLTLTSISDSSQRSLTKGLDGLDAGKC